MASCARYLVTEPPGAFVRLGPGYRFVNAGEVITVAADDDDFVPSRTFRALNEEAVAALAKLGVKGARIVRLPTEDPRGRVETGVSLAELGEMNRRGQTIAMPDAKPRGGKRAADK